MAASVVTISRSLEQAYITDTNRIHHVNPNGPTLLILSIGLSLQALLPFHTVKRKEKLCRQWSTPYINLRKKSHLGPEHRTTTAKENKRILDFEVSGDQGDD